MRKKAQGMSINTIIIAAIALIVMTLIVMIVTGGLGDLGRRSNGCRANGGDCLDQNDVNVCKGEFEQERSDLSCYGVDGKKTDELCCMRLLE